MSPLWAFIFCRGASALSGLLGAGGSICLAVPWAADLALRLRTYRRMRRAIREHGVGSSISATLSELHSRQLNQPPSTSVALLGILGALMLAISFAIILGGAMRDCSN